MKISDLLRRAADAIDQQENPGGADERLQNVAHMSPASAGLEVDTVHNHDAGMNDEPMVPPLQRKIELVKGLLGVDTAHDEQCADGEDELALIKRNAGIDTNGIF
jgi:hypothetical protein